MAVAAQRNAGSLLRRLRKGRFVAVFGLALAFFLACRMASFLSLPPVRDVEAMAHDAHFQLRDGKDAFPGVAIVGINSSSLDQQALENLPKGSEAAQLMSENTWPWPRSIHARVID